MGVREALEHGGMKIGGWQIIYFTDGQYVEYVARNLLSY